VNLDELRTVQMKERKKDSLQHLRDSFYADVATYIEDLKAQRSRAAEQADDPFSSPEVGRLSDEIETAEEVAEAVYERRVGKVVKLASFAAADMPVDQEGMTTEERRLFDDLVARIEQNKTTVLDTLAGKHVETTDEASATSEAAPAAAGGTPTPSEPSPADSATAGRAENPATTADTDGRATTDRESPESGSGGGEGGGMLADAMGGDDTGATDTSAEEPHAPSESGDGTGGRPIPPDEPPTDGAASDGGTVTADAGGSPAGGSGGSPAGDSGGSPANAGGDAPAGSAPAGDGPAGDAPAADAESVSTGAGDTGSADDTDRTTVRITRDVGAIFGVDEREYELSTEDVVTLPSANADPLLERDAAERID
jgi:DNA replication factor GINS